MSIIVPVIYPIFGATQALIDGSKVLVHYYERETHCLAAIMKDYRPIRTCIVDNAKKLPNKYRLNI